MTPTEIGLLKLALLALVLPFAFIWPGILTATMTNRGNSPNP